MYIYIYIYIHRVLANLRSGGTFRWPAEENHSGQSPKIRGPRSTVSVVLLRTSTIIG